MNFVFNLCLSRDSDIFYFFQFIFLLMSSNHPSRRRDDKRYVRAKGDWDGLALKEREKKWHITLSPTSGFYFFCNSLSFSIFPTAATLGQDHVGNENERNTK
jgi:hypothetical protein